MGPAGKKKCLLLRKGKWFQGDLTVQLLRHHINKGQLLCAAPHLLRTVSLEAPANSQQCLWTPALLITAIAFLVLINFIANSSFPSPFKPCFCVTLEDNVYVFTHQFPVSHMHCSSAFLWVCYFWLYRGNHLPFCCVLQHFVHSRSFSGICISIFYLEVRDQNLLNSDSISENLT